MELILASKNSHKADEIAAILGESYKILTQDSIGVTLDVEEDGDTFEANAQKKAIEIMNETGRPTIADDSGLVVDFLKGEPGVKTARYAGVRATDEQNIEKLLNALKDVPFPDRTARFVCVIALALPEKKVELFRGELEGKILTKPYGHGGFGYDPVFFSPQYDCSLAELEPHIKNAISHRGRALRKLAVRLSKI